MENMSISKEAFIDRLEAFMKMEKLKVKSLYLHMYHQQL